MFIRKPETYNITYSKEVEENILRDKANPINCILNMISGQAVVLDIGAGNGILGWMLSNLKPEITVDGIEPSHAGAKIGAKYYRYFYNDTLQNVRNSLNWKQYDFVVLADIIEHIENPVAFLAEIIASIKPETKILMSIPNIAHGSIRLQLLNGRFEYVDSGLLEKTHLRFFTINTIKQMIAEAGAYPEQFFYLMRDYRNSLDDFEIKPGVLGLCKLFNDPESYAYQYLVKISTFPVLEEEAALIGDIQKKSLLKSILKGALS